jgi:uncharacterized protein (DUF2141 family)
VLIIKKDTIMKTLSLCIALIISTNLSFAQSEKGQNVTVTIENIANNRGHVVIALHTADTFMKTDGLQKSESKVKDGKVIVTFKNVAPGNYALLALHDENDNKRMDFEPSGMPLESFGLSNNPILMGPPAFSDGKFEVADKNLELTIKF